MTVLNLTLAPDRAVLAQETGTWARIQAGEVAPAPWEEVQKLLVVPESNLVAGVIGCWQMARMWRQMLRHGGSMTVLEGQPGPDETCPKSVLQDLVELHRPSVEEYGFGTILAFWSNLEGRVVADRYEWHDDFDPHRLADGFTSCPQADPTDDRVEKLKEAAEPEALRSDPYTFHRELFGNQYRAWQAGRVPFTVSLSQDLQLAEVTAEGVTGPWDATQA